jgi:multidrug efflux pump subunit AcrA (membrane-fusion protein)
MIADAQLDEVRHEANERAMVLARHMATLADFPNQVQQTAAAVKEARARFEQARLDLAHTDVKAPFNGRVLRLEVASGDRISAGTALVQVADFERLQIRAPVPGEVAHRLRTAMAMDKSVVASSTVIGNRLGFELIGLAGDVKAGQSGIDAFFRVAPDAVIALGSIVNLNLALPEIYEVVPLPVHALYDNNRVYRIHDNRLQAVSVERVGEHLDDHGNYRVLVRSTELKSGDQLMISQLPAAITGLLVSPVEATIEEAPVLAGQWSSQ